MHMRVMDSDSEDSRGVVELEDEEVLQFIERNKAANTVRKTRSEPEYLVSCIPHSYWYKIQSV
jgi:hypothetical protein